jgi:hypothetical protein
MKAQSQKLFLMAVILMAFLSAPLFAQDDDPPGRVARLGYVNGNVSFQPSGEDQWSQALANYPLTTGDRIYTDRDGRAELETGNIAVRLSSGTDVATTSLNDQLVQLGLAQGTLRVRAYEIRSGNSVEIDTPNAALTLLRAGSYRVETFPDDDTTLVTVNSGDLEISGNGLSQVVHSGQSVKLSGDQEVRMEWLQSPGDDDFDRWSGDRDRRFTSSNSRQYVGGYVPGYSDLDQYGRWEPASEYGQVWYPNEVPAGWAPYRYGRWAWVEPWGWTWVEDEPWGFAPFHYGRWALVGSRWGWVPGTVGAPMPIYAPALVAFVGGSGANVQVWFPLGPRDPYFPWYHHSDGYLRQVNVTNVRTEVNIVNVINVRNVNNVHYAYQRVAPTAVSSEAFRGSRPVAREIVHVDVNQIGRAQVIPHPELHPDAGAIHAGTLVAHPPVERTRPRIESRAPVATGNQPGQPQRNDRNQPSEKSQGNDRSTNANGSTSTDRTRQDSVRTPLPGGNPPATDVRKGTPPPSQDRAPAADNRNDNRETAPDRNRPAEVTHNPPPSGQNPPPVDTRHDVPGRENPNANGTGDNRAQNNAGRGPANGPPQERRPLVTKTAPPPQNPSFSQRQGPLQDHPGRPLEPQQVENIRRGQPAGQMHDREVPAHREQAPQPSNQKGPAPPSRQEERGKDRPK